VTSVVFPVVGDLSAETVTGTLNRFGDTVGLSTSVSSTPLVSGLTRTPTGQLASRTLGDGWVRDYTWDVMDGSLTSAQASYDDDGVQMWVQYDVYAHDDAGRVTSDISPGWWSPSIGPHKRFRAPLCREYTKVS